MVSRNVWTVDDVTYHLGWDGPTQSFFISRKNPEPDPCENCDKGYDNGMCPELCPGHEYQEIICLYGPMTGKMVRTIEVFEAILKELGLDADPKFKMWVKKLHLQQRNARKPSALQMMVSEMFASIQEDVEVK